MNRAERRERGERGPVTDARVSPEVALVMHYAEVWAALPETAPVCSGPVVLHSPEAVGLVMVECLGPCWGQADCVEDWYHGEDDIAPCDWIGVDQDRLQEECCRCDGSGVHGGGRVH